MLLIRNRNRITAIAANVRRYQGWVVAIDKTDFASTRSIIKP